MENEAPWCFVCTYTTVTVKLHADGYEFDGERIIVLLTKHPTHASTALSLFSCFQLNNPTMDTQGVFLANIIIDEVKVIVPRKLPKFHFLGQIENSHHKNHPHFCSTRSCIKNVFPQRTLRPSKCTYNWLGFGGRGVEGIVCPAAYRRIFQSGKTPYY